MIGGGPARRLFQMEPATHDDVCNNGLKYRSNISDQAGTLLSSAAPQVSPPGRERHKTTRIEFPGIAYAVCGNAMLLSSNAEGANERAAVGAVTPTADDLEIGIWVPLLWKAVVCGYRLPLRSDSGGWEMGKATNTAFEILPKDLGKSMTAALYVRDRSDNKLHQASATYSTLTGGAHVEQTLMVNLHEISNEFNNIPNNAVIIFAANWSPCKTCTGTLIPDFMSRINYKKKKHSRPVPLPKTLHENQLRRRTVTLCPRPVGLLGEQRRGRYRIPQAVRDVRVLHGDGRRTDRPGPNRAAGPAWPSRSLRPAGLAGPPGHRFVDRQEPPLPEDRAVFGVSTDQADMA